MADKASKEVEHPPWVPKDVYSTLAGTGNEDVDAARSGLYEAIHFTRDNRFLQPTIMYRPNTDMGKELEHDKVNRHEIYECRKHTFHYRRDANDNPIQKYWSELLIVTSKRIEHADCEHPLALFVDFHGGGFTTGDIHHEAWRQKHKLQLIAEHDVVCVCPNYPLLPLFDGTHIYDAIKEFWHYIYSDAFKKDLTAVNPKLNVSLANIIVSGDSAGAWLALHSWLDPTLGPNSKPLNIAAVYMQYPMLRHYQRDMDKEKGADFMGRTIKLEESKAAGEELRRRWDEWQTVLKKTNTNPLDIDVNRPWAPLGMSAAFVGSHNHPLWKDMFQNGNKDLKDMVERVSDPSTKADLESRKHLPVIYTFHGDEDLNCPFADAKKVMDLLEGYYQENPNIEGNMDTGAESKQKSKAEKKDVSEYIQFFPLNDRAHGFDHNLEVSELPCLEVIHGDLRKRFELKTLEA